jgi:hypothetical protein
MAWVGVDLDETLVTKQVDEMGQPMEGGEDMPSEGAVEAMQQLAAEGHRLTIFTSRFAPMPESEKQRLKEQIEQEIQQMGFPPMEVWTGTTKPSFDVYIGNEAITYDNDWGLALAQVQYMLEEKGLLLPQADMQGEEPQDGAEQPSEDPVEEDGGEAEPKAVPKRSAKRA